MKTEDELCQYRPLTVAECDGHLHWATDSAAERFQLLFDVHADLQLSELEVDCARRNMPSRQQESRRIRAGWSDFDFLVHIEEYAPSPESDCSSDLDSGYAGWASDADSPGSLSNVSESEESDDTRAEEIDEPLALKGLDELLDRNPYESDEDEEASRPGSPPPPPPSPPPSPSPSPVGWERDTIDKKAIATVNEYHPPREGYCPFCGAHYTRLDKHSLLHKGVKPYKCKFCPKAFRQSGHLKRHVNSHHTTRLTRLLFQCRFCEKNLSRKDKLKEHQLGCPKRAGARR